MVSKPPATGLDRKESMSFVQEFYSIFIQEVVGRKVEAAQEEFTLSADKGDGRRWSGASGVAESKAEVCAALAR